MSLGFPGLVWRTAVRSRGFLVGSVVTLGFSIAVLVAGYRIGDAAWLSPLRQAAEQGLSRVITESSYGGNMSFPDYADFTERSGNAGNWAAVDAYNEFSVEVGGRVQVHPAAIVSHTYFALVGARFVAGTNWPQSGGGERLATGGGVMVSERFCRERLAPGVDPVGLPIRIATVPYMITGVVPDQTVAGETLAPDVWVALADSGPIANPWALTDQSRGYFWLEVWMKADPADPAAQGELETIGAELIRENPETRSLARYRLLSPAAAFAQTDREATGMYVTAAAVAAAIFLIAVCNVSILGLLQILRRGPELGVRMALGATGWQLLREVGWLGLWLAGGAMAMGVVGATGILGLVARFGPADLAAVVPTGISGSMLGLAAGLAGVAASVVVVVQAVVVLRGQTHPLVRDQRSFAGRHANRWFLAVQVALALALAIPAGLLMRSAAKVLAADLGYEREGLLIVQVDVRDRGFDKTDGLAYWQRVHDAAAVHPLIVSAGLSNRAPFYAVGLARPWIDGVEVSREIGYNIVGPGFFRTLGQQMIEGRDISLDDNRLDARVIVINEALAKAYWPGESAIGHSVLVFPGRPESRIIGVTQDLRVSAYGRHEPMIYVPIGIGWSSQGFLYLRHRGSTAEAKRAAEAMLAQADPLMPAREMVSFNEAFARETAALRVGAQTLALLAALALGLAAVGTYAIAAFSTEQRRYEIAVRLALGAERRGIFRLLVLVNLWPWVVGLAVGGFAGWQVGRFSAPFLIDVATFDGATFAAAGLAVGIVSVASVIVAALVHYPRRPFGLLRA